MVQLGGAYLPVYVCRHLPVVLWAEGTWQFHLHRLRGRKGLVQAGALAGQRLVPLVGFIRNEDRLRLAVRPERDRLGCSTFTPEPGQDARQPRPYLRQRVHLSRSRVNHTDSVPKLVQVTGMRA
jgi:hypothetical protein